MWNKSNKDEITNENVISSFKDGEEFNEIKIEEDFENEKRKSLWLQSELERKIEEQKNNEATIIFLKNKIIELKGITSKYPSTIYPSSTIKGIDYKLKNSEERIIGELKELKIELTTTINNSRQKENYTEILFFLNSIILIILIAYLSNLFSKLIKTDKEKSENN
ncbi:MAG: hypothetical protein AM1032_000051 [Mycoplasmataceae bacterium]|nr:MAG: hypothetical protein AM1032_000051 [Mycoplasmataceae bacterium]